MCAREETSKRSGEMVVTTKMVMMVMVESWETVCVDKIVNRARKHGSFLYLVRIRKHPERRHLHLLPAIHCNWLGSQPGDLLIHGLGNGLGNEGHKRA